MSWFRRRPAFEVMISAENAFGEPLTGVFLVRAQDEIDAVETAKIRARSYFATRSVKAAGLKSCRSIGWWEAFTRGAY